MFLFVVFSTGSTAKLHLKDKQISPRNEFSTAYFDFFFLKKPLSFLFYDTIGSGRTLRETVLESSPVLALLNQSFISSWSLVRELENMQVSNKAEAQQSTIKQLHRSICINHWNACYCTGWWAEPCVERKGPITPGEVQLPCGDDGGAAQWNSGKYLTLLITSKRYETSTRVNRSCAELPHVT